MALLGQAAVAMWWHIAAETRDEFLDWHTHEHLAERLGIDGFLRGTRWSSLDNATGFFVMYELRDQATLTGPAYLERLNHPTPWSVKMMPHHARMVRSLTDVSMSAGMGLGKCVMTLRLSPAPGRDADLRAYLAQMSETVVLQRGVAGVHLLESRTVALAAPTREQQIRGGDKSADWIVLVHGYDAAALRGLGDSVLAATALEPQGAQAMSAPELFELSASRTCGERDPV